MDMLQIKQRKTNSQGSHLTKEYKNLILETYLKRPYFWCAASLARKFDVSYETIRNILKKHEESTTR